MKPNAIIAKGIRQPKAHIFDNILINLVNMGTNIYILKLVNKRIKIFIQNFI